MENKTFKRDSLYWGDSEVYTHVIGFEAAPYHNHDFIECFYVKSGACIHEINSQTEKLTFGDFYLLVPSDWHKFLRSEENGPFTHRDIIFSFDYFKSVCDTYSPELYSDIIGKKYKLNFNFSNEEIIKIENLISFINNKKSGNADKENALYALATKTLCKEIINVIIEKNITETSIYPKWINDFLFLMDEPSNLKKTLKELTQNYYLSKSYMCRVFKQNLGMTMIEFFNKQKIQYAYYLLCSTDMNIEKICGEVGINNVQHFYPMFKKYIGMTPNAVRKNRKQEKKPEPLEEIPRGGVPDKKNYGQEEK